MDTTSPLEAEALSLQEFVAILQLEDPNELANGLKTCRDAILHDPRLPTKSSNPSSTTVLPVSSSSSLPSSSSTDDNPLTKEKSLAEQYLTASPEAAELFAIWDTTGKSSTNRIATLLIDLVGVILAFAPTTLAFTVARQVLKTRGKSLSLALTSTSPRLIRCTLRLLTTIVNLGPSLAREIVRKILLPPNVIEALAGTRHDTPFTTTTTSTNNGNNSSVPSNSSSSTALSKRAIKASKRTLTEVSSDPSAIGKHVYIHGRPGDDVRSNFIRYIIALLTCTAGDVVKDTVRKKGLIFSILKGLHMDEVHIILEALGALGDAFLLSGFIPRRATMEIFNSNALSMLLGLYSIGLSGSTKINGSDNDAQEKQRSLLGSVRIVLHIFLVGISTGYLLRGYEVEAIFNGEFNIDDKYSNSNVSTDKDPDSYRTGTERSSNDTNNKHARKRMRLSSASSSAKLRAGGATSFLYGKRKINPQDYGNNDSRNVVCVFNRIDTSGINGNESIGLSSDTGNLSIMASSSMDPVTAMLLTTTTNVTLSSAAMNNMDEESELTNRRLAVLDALSNNFSTLNHRNKRTNGSMNKINNSLIAPTDNSSATSGSSVYYDTQALAFLTHIKPSEDIAQADLLLRILDKFPNLWLAYFQRYPVSLDARVSSRWLANVRFTERLLTMGSSTITSSSSSDGSNNVPVSLVYPLMISRHAIMHVSSSSDNHHYTGSVTITVPGDNEDQNTISGVSATVLAKHIIPSSALSRNVLTRGLLHQDHSIIYYTLQLLSSLLQRIQACIYEICTLQPTFRGKHTRALVNLSSLSAEQQQDISNQLAQAQAQRALMITRACAPLLPDIQAIVSVRTKASALVSSSSSVPLSNTVSAISADEKLIDIEMLHTSGTDGSGDMIGEVSIAGVNLASSNDDTTTSSRSKWVSKRDLHYLLLQQLYTVLRLYIQVLPSLVLVNNPTLANTSNNTAFEFLRLIQGYPDNTQNTESSLALFTLLLSLPSPTPSEIMDKWMGKLIKPSSSNTGTDVIHPYDIRNDSMLSLYPVPDVSSSGSTIVTDIALFDPSTILNDYTQLLQYTPLNTLLRSFMDTVNIIGTNKTNKDNNTSNALLYELHYQTLLRILNVCIDPSASIKHALASTEATNGAMVTTLSSSSSASSASDPLNIQDMLSIANTKIPLLNSSPLMFQSVSLSPLAHYVSTIVPSLYLTETHVWLNSLHNEQYKTEFVNRTSALYGLLWMGIYDQLPNIALLPGKHLQQYFPMVLRSWIFFIACFCNSVEETLSNVDEENTVLSSATQAIIMQNIQRLQQQCHLEHDNNENNEGISFTSGTTMRSAILTQTRNTITRIITHPAALSYLIDVSQNILVTVPETLRTIIRDELQPYLVSFGNTLTVISVQTKPKSNDTTISTVSSTKKDNSNKKGEKSTDKKKKGNNTGVPSPTTLLGEQIQLLVDRLQTCELVPSLSAVSSSTTVVPTDTFTVLLNSIGNMEESIESIVPLLCTSKGTDISFPTSLYIIHQKYGDNGIKYFIEAFLRSSSSYGLDTTKTLNIFQIPLFITALGLGITTTSNEESVQLSAINETIISIGSSVVTSSLTKPLQTYLQSLTVTNIPNGKSDSATQSRKRRASGIDETIAKSDNANGKKVRNPVEQAISSFLALVPCSWLMTQAITASNTKDIFTSSRIRRILVSSILRQCGTKYSLPTNNTTLTSKDSNQYSIRIHSDPMYQRINQDTLLFIVHQLTDTVNVMYTKENKEDLLVIEGIFRILKVIMEIFTFKGHVTSARMATGVKDADSKDEEDSKVWVRTVQSKNSQAIFLPQRKYRLTLMMAILSIIFRSSSALSIIFRQAWNLSSTTSTLSTTTVTVTSSTKKTRKNLISSSSLLSDELIASYQTVATSIAACLAEIYTSIHDHTKVSTEMNLFHQALLPLVTIILQGIQSNTIVTKDEQVRKNNNTFTVTIFTTLYKLFTKQQYLEALTLLLHPQQLRLWSLTQVPVLYVLSNPSVVQLTIDILIPLITYCTDCLTEVSLMSNSTSNTTHEDVQTLSQLIYRIAKVWYTVDTAYYGKYTQFSATFLSTIQSLVGILASYGNTLSVKYPSLYTNTVLWLQALVHNQIHYPNEDVSMEFSRSFLQYSVTAISTTNGTSNTGSATKASNKATKSSTGNTIATLLRHVESFIETTVNKNDDDNNEPLDLSSIVASPAPEFLALIPLVPALGELSSSKYTSTVPSDSILSPLSSIIILLLPTSIVTPAIMDSALYFLTLTLASSSTRSHVYKVFREYLYTLMNKDTVGMDTDGSSYVYPLNGKLLDILEVLSDHSVQYSLSLSDKSVSSSSKEKKSLNKFMIIMVRFLIHSINRLAEDTAYLAFIRTRLSKVTLTRTIQLLIKWCTLLSTDWWYETGLPERKVLRTVLKFIQNTLTSPLSATKEDDNTMDTDNVGNVTTNTMDEDESDNDSDEDEDNDEDDTNDNAHPYRAPLTGENDQPVVVLDDIDHPEGPSTETTYASMKSSTNSLATVPFHLLSIPGIVVLIDIFIGIIGNYARMTDNHEDETMLDYTYLVPLLVRHPSFLHLLLRDRYREPYLSLEYDKGSYAYYMYQADNILHSLYNTPEKRYSTQLYITNINNGMIKANGLPTMYDNARLAIVRFLLRLYENYVHSTNDRSLFTTYSFLLPVLAAAYTASLSSTDRYIRKLFDLYEQHGFNLSSIGYVWSAAALPLIQWSSPYFGWRTSNPLTTTTILTNGKHGTNTKDSGDGTQIPTIVANPAFLTSFDWLYAGEREKSNEESTGSTATNQKNNGKNRRNGKYGSKRSGTKGTGGDYFHHHQYSILPGLSGIFGPRLFTGRELAYAQTGIVTSRVSSTLSHFPIYRTFSHPDNLQDIPSNHNPLTAATTSTTNNITIYSLTLLPIVRFSDNHLEFLTLANPSLLGTSSSSSTTLYSSTHFDLALRHRLSTYDPSFLLPALLHVCASGRIQPRRFVACGALTYVLACTTSGRTMVRQAAYAVLGSFYELISSPTAKLTLGKTFRELPQIRLLITAIRNSVTQPLQRLSSLHIAFAGEALHVLMRPNHVLYESLNRFLIAKSSLDLQDVPMLYRVISAGDVQFSMRWVWLLRILGRALQTITDHAILRRRHAYHIFLSLAMSVPAEQDSEGIIQRNVMNILLNAARLHINKDDPQANYKNKHSHKRKKWQRMMDEEDGSSSSSSSDSSSLDSEVVDTLGQVEHFSTNFGSKENTFQGKNNNKQQQQQEEQSYGNYRGEGFGDEDEEYNYYNNTNDGNGNYGEYYDNNNNTNYDDQQGIDGGEYYNDPSATTTIAAPIITPVPVPEQEPYTYDGAMDIPVASLPLNIATYLHRSVGCIPWIYSLWNKVTTTLMILPLPVRIESIPSKIYSNTSGISFTQGKIIIPGVSIHFDVLLQSTELLLLLAESTQLYERLQMYGNTNRNDKNIMDDEEEDDDDDMSSSSSSSSSSDSSDSSDNESVSHREYLSSTKHHRHQERLLSDIAEIFQSLQELLYGSVLLIQRIIQDTNLRTVIKNKNVLLSTSLEYQSINYIVKYCILPVFEFMVPLVQFCTTAKTTISNNDTKGIVIQRIEFLVTKVIKEEWFTFLHGKELSVYLRAPLRTSLENYVKKF